MNEPGSELPQTLTIFGMTSDISHWSNQKGERKMNDFELQIINIGKQSELYISGESFHQDDFEYEVSLADAKEAVAILNEFIELKEND